jgi:hypothetical protein
MVPDLDIKEIVDRDQTLDSFRIELLGRIVPYTEAVKPDVD